MFDPVVGQIMRIYGYFVMKKEEHELRVMQRTGSLMYQLAHKRTQPKISGRLSNTAYCMHLVLLNRSNNRRQAFTAQPFWVTMPCEPYC